MTVALSLLPLLVLLGCTDKADDAAEVCCAGDGGAASDGGGDTGGGITATPWELHEIQPVTPTIEYVDAARQVFRASGNDFTYIVNGDGAEIRYLTGSYVQPMGDLCLDETGQQQSFETCTATRFTAGRLTTSSPSPAVCLDDVDDRLIMVKEGGGRLELAGTSKRGETHLYYNRIFGVRSVELAEGDAFEGPCAARGGRIVLSGGDEIAILQDVDGQLSVASRVSYPGGLADLQWLGDSKWLIAHGKDGNVWAIDSETGVKEGNLSPAADARTIAIDPGRQVVWLAGGRSGSLLRVPFTHAGMGAPAEVSTGCGRIEQLAVDHRSGAVHVLATCGEALDQHELLIVSEAGVHAAQRLDETPLGLVPPGGLGHLAVIVRTEAGKDTAGEDVPAAAAVRAWAPRDPLDTRPPLTMWVVTTLEEPFSANPKVCTPEENPNNNFGDLLDQLRANIPLLQATGLPVAVGMTWEFLNNAEHCDQLGIIDELRAAGFHLGYMIHDRPCYSCTDGTVAGENPDYCGPNDYDYDAPGSASACWPSNANYCAWYDQECWYEWTNAKQLDVDEWLGGSQFIFGADRHWLYGWEYIQDGYRRYDRIDGSKGYDITMFQGNWVYPDIEGQEDPRAKDPAPWTPELLGNTWFPGHCESWEEDSAFSELVYMPGNSIAVSRLYDMQQYDLSMVHLTTEFTGITAQESDFQTLLGLLGQAVGHRTERPGTFYFHLPDLTGYAMQPGDDRPDYTVLLPAFEQSVDELYGEGGVGAVRWGTPLEAKAEVDAWVEQYGR